MRHDEAFTLGLAAWAGQSKGMVEAHRHHDLELNYVCDGSMTYLIGGRLVTLPRRRLCALWGAGPHQSIATGRDNRVIWVTVPLSQVLAWAFPESFVSHLLSAGLAVDPHERSADEPVLRQWIDDLAAGPANHAVVLLEIEARLRRLAQALPRSPQGDALSSTPAEAIGSGQPAGLAAVQRMAQFMVEHCTQPIRAKDIAAAGHVHPNYAMHLFRKHLRMTIHDYLTRQRIAHAQRLLATTDLPVLETGLSSGFQSPSRFFEMFKQHTGCTPRQFRRQLRG